MRYASRGAGDLAILGLHVRHDRPAQGRHAFQPQRDASDAPCKRRGVSFTDSEERLVFLPLCMSPNGWSAITFSLPWAGDDFAESPETVPDNLREVQPTAFLRCRGYWEKFTRAHDRAEGCNPVPELMYRQALAIGYRMTYASSKATRLPFRASLANRVGLPAGVPQYPSHARTGSLRVAITGAAPIAPDLIRWYLALGIDMREAMPDRKLRRRHRDACGWDQARLVGKAVPWGEVAISPVGES